MKEKIVITLPPIQEEEALRKFQGQVTGETLDAVRRMKAKPQTVTIPSHIVHKLWRATGGWLQGFSPVAAASRTPVEVIYVEAAKMHRAGDLKVVLLMKRYGNKHPEVYLVYRGIIAQIPDSFYSPQAKKDWRGNWEAGHVTRWTSMDALKQLWIVASQLTADEAAQLGFTFKN